MKARIRRISASVDTAISFNSNSSTDGPYPPNSDLNTSSEKSHGYNPSSKSLDINMPESRIERMRKLLSSPLLKRKNPSHHGPNCMAGHHGIYHYSSHCKQSAQQAPSSSSSPSSSPALGSSTILSSSSTPSMKTFGVSLESLANHQHPHHQQHHQHYPEEYYVRDPEQVIVPHQKAAHVLGQVCPGCLTSAPSNSSSTGSINDTATTNTTTTSSGHFTHHISSSHVDDFSSSMASSMVASPSSGASSSSTTSSTSSAGGPISSQCLIPFVVTRLCNYIETNDGMSHEGLFRISGNAKLVEKLKHCFDITGDAPLETEGDLASAATLLKQFLRELPQPLIPNGLQFLDVIRSLKNDHDTCVLSLKALVSQLPDENYYTLRYLIRFLYRIAQHNDENRMTSSNLGIVFAPNIFRVCVDTYQGLKDQSAANEVVNFLIIEFCDIFNDNGSSGGGGADSSREDLSSTHSYDLECQCSLNLDIAENELAHSASNCETLLHTVEPNNSIDGGETIIPNITFLEEKESDDGDVQPENRSTDESARIELDRKRKDYKSKNHRTIEEFDDDRCQSFDHGSGVQFPIIRPPPQRCNSDGNNEEMTYTMGTETHNQSLTGADELLRKYASNSRTHEIIITNSSDSVSTDDNTTTTATSTGATVCSVVIGGTGSNGAGLGNFPILDRRNENHPSSSDNNTDKCSVNEYKLLGYEGPIKTGRSGSCGSDCTENMNSIPTVFTDDDDEDDSLSKSIASECSSSDSSDSSCDTSNFSGHEAGSSSSPNEIGQDIVMESEIDNLNEDKPWIVNQNTSSTEPNNEPQLSVEPNVCNHDISIAFEFINNPQCLAQEIVDSKDGEAPVSSSAFRSYLSNRLEQTDLPPSALETIDYSRNNDGNIEQIQQAELNQNKQPQQSNKGVGQKGRNRRLHSIRRKLQQFKVDFEQENGYKPSYEQKMASSFARPLMLELSSLLNICTPNLKELDKLDQLESCECVDSKAEDQQLISLAAKSRSGVNQWKQPPSPSSTTTETDTLLSTEDIFNTIFGNPNEKSLTKISEMMDEIQRTLEEKRSASCRPESLDEMTSEQIFDEKLALQKALLRFEANNGRPNSKAERDIVRPVYDRYRLVKRYASRILQRLGSKDAINELQPILEHVQMDFKSPTHSCSNIETTTDEPMVESRTSSESDQCNLTQSKSIESNVSTLTVVTKSSSSGQVSSESCDMSNSANVIEALVDSNKNFHVMSREELLIQLRECRQHKRNLRAVLRTFENDFYKKTGRRVEKEDRCNMATVYHCYKNTKGKIRLLEALVAKCDRERNELSHKNV